MKKAQIEIKNSLKGEYEHKIETLEKDIQELKEKLQNQIEENLNHAAEINTNDFIFENERIIKNEVKKEPLKKVKKSDVAQKFEKPEENERLHHGKHVII